MRSQFDPGNPSNKARTRELQAELRLLLLEWDPIGVKGNPEAANEYDCLISPLMHLLADGESIAHINAWLARELIDHFGLTPTTQRDLALINNVVAWWRTATTDRG